MKTPALILVAVLVFVIILITATLFRNHARFMQPPGLAERLSVYLTQHEAVTLDNHAFPELRTPVFYVEAEIQFDTVLAVADDLGWQIEHSDNENLSAHMVVTTPLLQFKDDLVVQVKLINSELDGDGSALLVRSTSRVGKADFAANAGHIQALVAAVDYRLRSAARRLFETE